MACRVPATRGGGRQNTSLMRRSSASAVLWVRRGLDELWRKATERGEDEEEGIDEQEEVRHPPDRIEVPSERPECDRLEPGAERQRERRERHRHPERQAARVGPDRSEPGRRHQEV